MKHLIRYNYGAIAIIWLLSTSIVFGQENTIVWGRIDKWFSPEMVFRVEVLDQDSHMPIYNALVTLEANRTLTAKTDRNGICVILFISPGDLGSAKLKVSANNYRYWEEEFTYWDYKSYIWDNRLFILGMTMDWSSTERPSYKETINAIRYKNYRIIRDRNLYFQAPGIFEKEIILEFLDRSPQRSNKSRSRDRSKERSRSTNSRDQQSEREDAFNEKVYFSEAYYHETEWILELPSENVILYIKFRPGKMLIKRDPYLPYDAVDINWWIESGKLCIHLKPDMILRYHIVPGKNTYNGTVHYSQKTTTIRRK